MGYRFDDRPRPKPEDMLPKFAVRNGSIVDIAFPCFYLDVIDEHDSKYHDHIGWPSPTHVDCVCQFPGSGMSRIDFGNPHPIDLLSEYEGYTDAFVTLDEDIDGLEVPVPVINPDEPNTIYMRVKANLEFFEDKPKDVRFTLFAHAPARTYQGKQENEKIDQVIRGMITILPGNIAN